MLQRERKRESMESSQASGVDVFYSYAHKDEPLREALEKHLALLQHQGYIRQWHDRCIRAGADWAQAIDAHLNTASLILLLISADFLASPYCYHIEMKRALERHRLGEARVIPIIVRPVDWQISPFAELQALPKNGRPITKWKNRDEAFQDVAKGLRAAIDEMHAAQSGGQRTSSLPSAQSVYWNVPYHRNPFFTNREKILEGLYRALHATATTTVPRALSGMSGVGKTQAVVEYAYRYQHQYQYCFWLSSDTHETLLTDVVTLADQLNLPEKRAQDYQTILRGVKRWLQNHQNWLLIFDNADNLAIIRDFLPQQARGHIVLTTRAYALGGLAQRVEVEHMGPEEGALFLLRRAGLLTSEGALSDASPSDVTAAKAFCELVGGLPLALDQAGAYIEEVSCSVQEYLALFRVRQAELLKRRGGTASDHPESLATTLALSLQKVQQANPAAADLLRLLSFLQPDELPEEVLTPGAAELGPLLQPVVADPLRYHEALKELFRFSLVHRDPATKTLSLHRLTQAVVKDTLSESEQREWARRVVLMLCRVFPNPRYYANWDLCQRCLPQAEVVVALITQWHFADAESAQLLNRLGYYLKRRGRYDEAERLYQYALELGSQAVGEEHPVYAETLFRLGDLLHTKGNYAEAEQRYQHALKIREQVLGPDHPDVALSLHNRALLDDELGKKPSDVEALYLRALAIWEHALGLRHPDVAEGLNNLASLYRKQGRLAEAEVLLKRALLIRKEVFGEESPDLLLSMEALAELYLAQGDDEHAETLLRDGLAMCERVLGEAHPHKARFLSDLRELALHRHQYAEAERYVHQTIAIDAQSLGENHPYMIEHAADLAHIYALEQRYAEAEQVYQRALPEAEKTFGAHHAMVATLLTSLADVYVAESKYVEAESLYERALAIQEGNLGSDHPEVADILEKMAVLLRTTQREKEAEAYEHRVHSIRSQ
jgi:tetratricopeptide (TPR) repeat protein